MLDPNAAAHRERRQRRVALAALAVLAVLVHGLMLGSLDRFRLGAGRDDAGAPMSVRTIAAEPAAGSEAVATAATAEAAAPATPAVAPRRTRPARSAREPARVPDPSPAAAAASAPVVVAETTLADALSVASADPAANADLAVSTADATEARPPAAETSSPAASTASQPLLAAGEEPPPVYRTQLPPSSTLRYQVRSGFFRGTGEIRWRRTAEGYSLALDARVAGLTLLRMASDGAIDAAGLAPQRFVDQRARRPPQAANFQRDAGKITFSGPAVEWPLLAGTQDQLSWMIQLAAIASADPGLLVEGGRITMVVVGARGDARLWTLRYAGRENVETRAGTVAAIKLVRDGAAAYDRGYEIWLDPDHSYLPAHVTQRNGAGSSEFDLLLDRIEPAP